ncbi:hypothetical protein [Staphylococcus aureus]|uniref:hypothetical protein n=1 Tax=Staphylococcus aureus TaxID=1280 RepID=UPI0038B27B1E
MNRFNQILYYLFYPIEWVLRFFFPYAFKDDPYNPEPQTKEERKARRIQKKHERQNRKGNKQGKQYIPPTPKKEDRDAVSEDVLAKLSNLKQHGKKAKKKELGIHMVDLENGLTNDSALDLMKEAEPKTAFYWHDAMSHQVAVKFEKGGLRDEYKTRDNAERQKLKPLIEPKQKGNRDRTHVIPIGYHGSESDKRLLVGFSSKLNQQDLKYFEDKAGKLNRNNSILWFVNIQKQKDKSVKWHAIVWNQSGEKLLEDTFHDKRPFVWKEQRF